ncbi:uncharacterized protein BCR38DRAFT_455643 [Pseudomassariella vexata]|uniref:Major facilitator superfamily transporter n=1 Tax=Pseudomassariella vexata TaxID=1141098 RepID=A0A1Y2EB25_9PEZI|nr:uncharacterized protein BCR38DRAFT_455643 [Pseudomassariella vexata]ORY68768.1 hypothetical protein BCR38DRAFT_455643 [Pseudomassariella vexata]
MDKVSSFFLRKPDSFSGLMSRKSEVYLPITSKPQPKFRVRALLGHCLYRRVVLWTLIVIVLLSVTLFNPRITQRHNVLDLVHVGVGEVAESKAEQTGDLSLTKQDGKNDADERPMKLDEEHNDDEQSENKSESTSEDKEREKKKKEKGKDKQKEKEQAKEKEKEKLNGPHWLRYKHLDGYYNGLRSLVSFSDYIPEYPVALDASQPTVVVPTVHRTALPTPTVYRSHPDYDSSEYRSEYQKVKPCYLDAKRKVPVPELYAYSGVPQGQAKPALGSYDLLGLREDVCFDRFGRYGPYGLGYPVSEGGTGEATDTEHEASEYVWQKTGKINWDDMDWAAAQDRCTQDNEARFFTGNKTRDSEIAKVRPRKIHRQAVVVRTYVGFKWTAHALLNFRAMISELNLQSSGEYDVHFLLHVRDNNAPIWADPATAQRILDANVPPEFHGICTLWSEAQMKLYYPGDFGYTFENPSNGDIHGVYRSAHMPLQHFANIHPEYEHFWNWEMDMRWSGSYYELFDRLGKWGQQQSRQGMWERASKYYIPELHGDWDNFTKIVDKETRTSGRRSIMGPVIFAGKTSLQHGEEGFLPRTCATGSDMKLCGVGEDADLITLNPLFDADQSGWVFASDVTGYDKQYQQPPRRCAIVTASRLSRRLLSVMHEETWRLHHSMFSEMFPPSMAFHHGLKAVYAPHPVYLDRAWPVDEIEKAFNGGRDHTSGGHGSPFDLMNEHNHKGTSWYYNSEFAGLLWRRWLGYAQMDGRGDNGGRAGEGTMRGGRDEEMDKKNSGRLCLRSMLVHPIKWENPSERD